MTPDTLFSRLVCDGFTLHVEGGKLVVQPASQLTDELRAAVRRHRDALLEMLAKEGGGPFAAPPPGEAGWWSYYSGEVPWPRGSIGARFLAAGGRG